MLEISEPPEHSDAGSGGSNHDNKTDEVNCHGYQDVSTPKATTASTFRIRSMTTPMKCGWPHQQKAIEDEQTLEGMVDGNSVRGVLLILQRGSLTAKPSILRAARRVFIHCMARS